MKRVKPDVIFSKGGFVTVPVVLAAKRKKVPCVLHESDISPGLANRLCIPSATAVCANFPETLSHLPEEKAHLTGSPIRKELFSGNRLNGLDFCGFSTDKPVILVIGGSLGSVRVNEAVRDILPELLEKYQVIHLCGKDKVDESLADVEGYAQFEYIQKELCDLLGAQRILSYPEREPMRSVNFWHFINRIFSSRFRWKPAGAIRYSMRNLLKSRDSVM